MKRQLIRQIINEIKPEIWISVAAVFMLLIYAPIDIFISNYEDFIFDIYDVLRYMLPMAVIVFILLVSALFVSRLIGEKVYTVLLCLEFFAVVLLYIQGTFFVKNLPLLDGSEIDWSSFMGQKVYTIITSALLIVFIISILKCAGRSSLVKIISYTGKIGTVFLAITLIMSVFTSGTAIKRRTPSCMTADSLFNMSEKENFIIFMLDSVDASSFKMVLENNPEYKTVFDDFTFYSNTLAGYPYTQHAVPLLLFNRWYENDIPYEDFLGKAAEESAFMKVLADKGYSRCVYFDYLQQANVNHNLFENFRDVNTFKNPDLFCKMLLKLVGFKYLPYDVKPSFVLSPSNIAYDSLKTNDNEDIDYYDYQNISVYNRIRNTDISIVDKGQFKFICTEGAHTPFVLDKNLEETDRGDYYQSIEGSITMTRSYLEKLKNAGVYDNSVIVILADHGTRAENPYAGTGRQNPILLIKGMNEHHDFQMNDAPISHEDLESAYFELLSGKDGNDCFQWNEGDIRTRRYMLDISKEGRIYEMETDSHASEIGALRETGRVFDGVMYCR